jgi:hypothetical protein
LTEVIADTVTFRNDFRSRQGKCNAKDNIAGARWWSDFRSVVANGGKDGVIGRPSLWIAEDFEVLRFRLMVKRGPLYDDLGGQYRVSRRTNPLEHAVGDDQPFAF